MPIEILLSKNGSDFFGAIFFASLLQIVADKSRCDICALRPYIALNSWHYEYKNGGTAFE
jgi:hypothetical protein